MTSAKEVLLAAAAAMSAGQNMFKGQDYYLTNYLERLPGKRKKQVKSRAINRLQRKARKVTRRHPNHGKLH